MIEFEVYMKSFCRVFVFALIMFCAYPVHAAVVSIRIMQHDKAADTAVLPESLIVEAAVMDCFFSAGDIVTNDPAFAAADTAGDAGELKKSLAGAKDNGVDYCVFITVEYDTAGSANPEGVLLSHIKSVMWTSWTVTDGKQIASGSQAPEQIAPDKDNEDGIKSFAVKMGRAIKTGLNRH